MIWYLGLLYYLPIVKTLSPTPKYYFLKKSNTFKNLREFANINFALWI
ncbi:hypothetical protein EDF66_104190 [Sphingobacterium sp. JUb20]|nr:hypothetical protein [Sphingobacterium sp. JUb21]TCR08085.1 hypothetical protein EDF66_104190 [Sphingobacterium sp. JUb20]